jgi:Uma2 family endonuclease
VSIQDPIRLADSIPEPDVALLAPCADYYATSLPGADDVLLIVEVADSSIELDAKVKRPLYAENGIGEYWIVNLVEGELEVHRNPQPNGVYRDVRRLSAGDSIELLNLPGAIISVAEVIGPRVE